jgi:hypothetical protein
VCTEAVAVVRAVVNAVKRKISCLCWESNSSSSAQDTDKWRDLVNAVRNLRVSLEERIVFRVV